MSSAVPRVVTAALGCFALRRLVFVAAAVAPRRPMTETPGPSPSSVCLIIPARNEAAGLEVVLESVVGLESPPVAVVLVDDGSSDATPQVMASWAAGREGWSSMRLDPGPGKAGALNAGLAAAPDQADLIAVCDADVRLAGDCLLALMPAFADPGVGAASGRLLPTGADRSIVSRYCGLELAQHQLVTSAGKDRLRLDPPAHGWLACYRRTALEQIGGFVPGSHGEDVEATAALVAAGWRTRFIPEARVFSPVPSRLSDYARQHVRWARGLHSAAPIPGESSIMRRIEGTLHAAGYLDRPLLLAAAALAARGALPAAVPAGYAGLTAAEALCALTRAGELRRAPRILAAVAAMLPIDLAVSVAGSCLALRGTAPTWESPARSGTGQAISGSQAAVSDDQRR